MSARLATAALIAMLAIAAPAQAARGLITGFANDPVLTNPPLVGASPAQQNFWAGKVRAIGGSMVRVNVAWIAVAPSVRPRGFNPANPASPGYNWTTIDNDVRVLAAHHVTPLLMLYWAPPWAEGANRPADIQPGAWKPNPHQFALFATAAARRFSGHFRDPLNRHRRLPRVRFWQAWNEPNLAYYLSPLWTPHGQPNSPNLYRPLLDAFYKAVKRVHRNNFVVSAGTSPAGDPPNVHAPGGQRMRPMVFYRSLFCVNSALHATRCPGPVFLDAVDHHPYEIPPPQVKAFNADDVVVPDIGKIRSALDAGLRAGHVLPHGSKSIWIGEITWDSNPPSTNRIAAPVPIQACYVELAMYLLWREGADRVLWLQLRDYAPEPGFGATFRWGGMFFFNGTPKPAATAFRFPFVAHRVGRSHVEVWGRAPASGVMKIVDVQSNGRTKTVGHLRVHAGQVFLTRVRVRGKFALQGLLGRNASLGWIYPGATCPSH